ncbi:MAG: serine/threonine protein kinase [Bacteroidales bacterium]|nr:serine/threonine protein kinase [Bacteroidales bacterium]
MDDVSTSGPIDETFISEGDIRTTYEEVPSRGFNRLMKVRRQGRWFMLKGLKSEYQNQAVYLELLRKEYALMVELDHPGIVKAYAKEINEVLGPCIVMEYIDGVRLDEFLAGKPSATARRKVLDQLVDALAYVHSKQVFHRDLKPANILITRNGNNVKIIDFGLSDADGYAVLKQSAGTPKYMAPEQLSGAAADCRTDIWSFGLLLRETFPRRYGRIASKCTRKDPDDRFAAMEEVREALARSDRWKRLIPVFVSGLVIVLAALLFFFRPANTPSGDFARPADNATTDQHAYLQKACWDIIVPIHQIIEEAKTGKEYREVLMARLSNLRVVQNDDRVERGQLYRAGSAEQLYFITQCDLEQNKSYPKALKAIDQNCRSFEEDYGKGRISQREYDSLKWVVSPLVTTLPLQEVKATSAVGTVDLPGGFPAQDVRTGLCWSPCHQPTVRDRHAEGRESIVLGGLAPGSTYFVRAYVETGAGITYGEEIAFTTADSTLVVPMGAAPGLYSVGEGRQVFFSQGNLQYRASTDTWRFAEHPFDFAGKSNLKMSPTYDGWIDLFAWATSGYDHGAVNYQPWSRIKDVRSDPLSYAYGKPDSPLYAEDGRADWGYNRIINGGDEEGQWRTPRVSEWVHLLFVRNTASGVRFAKASVAGVNGVILLPDQWKTSVYPLNSVNREGASYASNTVSLSDWNQRLAPAGAAFLPDAGDFTLGGILTVMGGYYTSDAAATDAWHFLLADDGIYFDTRGHRGDGLSVRLVRDAGE